MTNEEKQEIISVIVEYLGQEGSAIGTEKVRELTAAELTSDVLRVLTIPAVMMQQGREEETAEEWVQTSLANMMAPLNESKAQADSAASAATSAAAEVQSAISKAEQAASNANIATSNANTAASSANTAAGNANNSRTLIEANETTRQSNEQTRQSNEQTRQSNEASRTSAESSRATAEQSRVSAESARVSAEQGRVSAENAREAQVLSDHNRAESDHTASMTATAAAENVNAQLSQRSGAVILAVTNRDGSTTEKEVGFRFAYTYPSIDDMNADAENVEEGRFVLIASNVEDPHNAEFYVKNSQGTFTYQGDLSGAQGIKGDTPVMTASADGIIFADGQELTRIIKTAVETFLANEGFLSDSTRGDSSRWGQYKQAEYLRDGEYQNAEVTRGSQYATAEASRDNQYATAEDTRDTRYQTAESSRDNQYSTAESNRDSEYSAAETLRDNARLAAEGTSTSTAGDGTRWGTYKTAESERQTTFESTQTSRDTTWTNWFSDTLTTGVRKIWNTWYTATVTAWDNWFGTSTSTGVQGDWTALRADVLQKTTDANTAAQNANTKATEAGRVNATLSGTTITVTDRDGHQMTANLKGEQGTAAGFGTPTASIDANVGTPSVTITASGADTAKVFNFQFSNLKGEKGDNLDWDTMTPEEKQALVQEVLATIGFDDVPTENSDKAVKSSGLYDAFEAERERVKFSSIETCRSIIDELT